MSRLPSSPLARAAALGGASLVLVWVTYGSLTGLEMLGWDGWALVAAGRVASFGELVGTFGEELMDGRYMFGRFYRPITHLSFGLDHALYGLDASGYHWTDLILFSLAAASVAALGMRMGSPRATWVGAVAGVLFVLHPIQLELLPVSPRRADVLALGFTVATLLALPRGEARMSLWRAPSLAMLAFAAGGSKETGVIVAPLALAAGLWLWPRGESLGARLGSALGRAAPVFAGVALYVAARTAVLDGLGGHSEGLQTAGSDLATRWSELVTFTVYPEPLVGALPVALIVAAGVLFTVLAAFASRRGGEPREDASARPLFFLSAWALCVFGLALLADRSHEWYAMLLAVPWTMLLAATMVAAWDGRRRPLAAAAGGLALLFALTHLLASPLARDYRMLDAASEAARRNYSQLERDVGDASPGTVVQIQPWLSMIQPNADGSDVSALHVSAPYTIQAWCEMRWPDARFVVDVWRGNDPVVLPDKVHVQLIPSPEPRWVDDFR